MTGAPDMPELRFPSVKNPSSILKLFFLPNEMLCVPSLGDVDAKTVFTNGIGNIEDADKPAGYPTIKRRCPIAMDSEGFKLE